MNEINYWKSFMSIIIPLVNQYYPGTSMISPCLFKFEPCFITIDGMFKIHASSFSTIKMLYFLIENKICLLQKIFYNIRVLSI